MSAGRAGGSVRPRPGASRHCAAAAGHRHLAHRRHGGATDDRRRRAGVEEQRQDAENVGSRVTGSLIPGRADDTRDLAQRLSYSSLRRHQGPVSLRPLGARSSHAYMPQMPSSPRAYVESSRRRI